MEKDGRLSWLILVASSAALHLIKEPEHAIVGSLFTFKLEPTFQFQSILSSLILTLHFHFQAEQCMG